MKKLKKRARQKVDLIIPTFKLNIKVNSIGKISILLLLVVCYSILVMQIEVKNQSNYYAMEKSSLSRTYTVTI